MTAIMVALAVLMCLLHATHGTQQVQIPHVLNGSQASHGQDILVWERFFFPMGYASRPGVFVELGGYNGKDVSNTYALEQRGWTGVLLEPHPRLWSECAMHRAHCWQKCASNISMAWLTDKDSQSSITTPPESIETGYWIECISLSEALSFAASTRLEKPPLQNYVELLSLDVEGHEMEVLSSVDLTRWHIEVIIVEAGTGHSGDQHRSAKRAHQLRSYLVERGYRFIDWIGGDLIFKKVQKTRCSMTDGPITHEMSSSLVSDYQCPVVTAFFRLRAAILALSLFPYSLSEKLIFQLGQKNALFFPEDHLASLPPDAFGGQHSSESIYGGSRFGHGVVGVMPTAPFWLYHLSFFEVLSTPYSIFDTMSQLAKKFEHGMKQSTSPVIELVDCSGGSAERSFRQGSFEHVELVVWTCGSMDLASSHAERVATAAGSFVTPVTRRHLETCEQLVKEYSRRFGLYRMLVHGLRKGIWDALHRAQQRIFGTDHMLDALGDP